jgi:hypothetical protein
MKKLILVIIIALGTVVLQAQVSSLKMNWSAKKTALKLIPDENKVHSAMFSTFSKKSLADNKNSRNFIAENRENLLSKEFGFNLTNSSPKGLVIVSSKNNVWIKDNALKTKKFQISNKPLILTMPEKIK